jgi:very-short-patch-repair endonuclease
MLLFVERLLALRMAPKQKNMFDGAGNLLFAMASELRKRQTFAEELLWEYLKTAFRL